MKRVEHRRSYKGWQDVYQHDSKTLGCSMKFGIYLPDAVKDKKLPVLYFLSGLTCTEQNFITKANAQRYASEHEIIIVAPDSSPRGDEVPNDDAYDLGQGASFYVNATAAPWKKHFQMYDYIVNELPALIEENFPASEKKSIFGHSMGGHGALMIALKNPGVYSSVSAFSPIVAPTRVPWGEKAFGAYFGSEKSLWKEHDTVELVATAKEKLPLLVDQGKSDEFLDRELKPELLREACERANHPLELGLHDGFDHSYYFIASFMEKHVAHHAKALKK